LRITGNRRCCWQTGHPGRIVRRRTIRLLSRW